MEFDHRPIVSIIMVCYRQGLRARIFKQSINSLLENTAYPFELVLTDNTWNNRGLGAGRNESLRRVLSPYIAIVDDDILYEPGWLEACMEILKDCEKEKVIATPVHVDRKRAWWKKHYKGEYKGYTYHARSGSNCMVMPWSTFVEVGYFPNINPSKDGVKWCDWVVKKGVKVLLTKEPLAHDLSFNQHSYDKKQIFKTVNV